MPPLKITLLVIGAVLLLAVGGGVGLSLVRGAAKDHIKAGAKAAEAKARQFAKSTDQAGCLTEALLQLEGCDRRFCEFEIKLFLDDCARAARPTEGFCEGVPPDSDKIATSRWTLARCEQLGKRGDLPCTRVVGVVQDVCHKPIR